MDSVEMERPTDAIVPFDVVAHDLDGFGAAFDAGSASTALATRHADSDPVTILHAALERFDGTIALVSSFGTESAALLHMVAQIDRATPVVFLDTGRLFTQTLLYRNEMARRLGLTDLRTAAPDPARVAVEDPERLLSYRDPETCCWIRKVEPLDAALEPFQAWITGRKRYQAGTRAALAPFEAEAGRVKVNPLAGWSSADVNDYLRLHDLPPHPLVAEGYLSIGCAPCTTRVRPGEDARAGRWRGSTKVECGIHKPAELLGSGI